MIARKPLNEIWESSSKWIVFFFFFFFFNEDLESDAYVWLIDWLILAVLGLRFCARALSSCGKRGPLLIAMRGPLSLWSTGSRRARSAVVAHGPSRSAACGIFPGQGSNPCPPVLAGRFSTTAPPGKPQNYFFMIFFYLGNAYSWAKSIFWRL